MAQKVADFTFADEWPLVADPADVWDVVRNVGGWPLWWPSARRVTTISWDPNTGGDTGWRFEFRTRLPYLMIFEAHPAQEDRLHSVDCWITGRVKGRGRWAIQPLPGGSVVRFDWEISPQLLWMRAMSPLGRPVFYWNHRALMLEGGQSLARRLGVRLLNPPVSTPTCIKQVPATPVRSGV